MSDRSETPSEAGFTCVRCEQPGRDRIANPPFPNELGQRLVAEICATCWEEWKSRQMVIINHYGLKVRDPKAREFLVSNLRSFLFGEGDSEAEIDTTQEGKVSW